MHDTKNDLSAGVRENVVGLLNARLADSIDLMLQGKQAHWNVKGANFIALHELFDKLVEETEEWVDTIAERAVALGGTAGGTLELVARATTLPKYPPTLTRSEDHVKAMVAAHAAFGKAVRQAIEVAGQAGDAGTADLFTGVSRGVDKALWFLEAHLQG